MSNVTIHIDEIVVHGAGSMDADRFQQTVQQELSRHILANGLPPTWQQGEVHLSALRATLNTEAMDDATIGRAVAKLIYSGES